MVIIILAHYYIDRDIFGGEVEGAIAPLYLSSPPSGLKAHIIIN